MYCKVHICAYHPTKQYIFTPGIYASMFPIKHKMETLRGTAIFAFCLIIVVRLS